MHKSQLGSARIRTQYLPDQADDSGEFRTRDLVICGLKIYRYMEVKVVELLSEDGGCVLLLQELCPLQGFHATPYMYQSGY